MNTLFRGAFLAAILTFMLAAPVLADTLSHEEGGIRVDIPDGWLVEIDEHLLIVSDPAEEVSIFIFVSELQIVEHFTNALIDEVAKVITKPEVVSEAVQTESNGLFRFHAEGFGLHESDIVDWDLTFIAGARKSMILIALGSVEDHREQVDGIYASIQPVEPIEVEEEEAAGEDIPDIEAPR